VSTWRRGTWILAIALCAPPSAAADFVDVTDEAGLASGGGKAAQAWADVNGDGWPDVVLSSDLGTTLHFNDGGSPPSFDDVTVTHAPGLATVADRVTLFADLSHDGWPDLVRTDGDVIEIWLSRGPDASPPFSFGSGKGAPSSVIRDADTPFGMNAEGVGLVDVDGDGWLDLLADNQGSLRIYGNPADGSAAFAVVPRDGTGLPLHAGVSSDFLAVADFDVDGFVDVAWRPSEDMAMMTFPILHRNQGDGTFVAIDDPQPTSLNLNKGGNLFCDFDSDGDFDLFFSDGTGPGVNAVYLNDAGTFTDSGVATLDEMDDVDGVDCGDVDHDGDLDLFLTTGGSDPLFINQLVETGSFDLVRDDRGVDANGVGATAVFVDYDRDGDLDLYVHEAMTSDFFRNDQDDDAYLVVRVLTDVGSCPDSPAARSDVGAVVTVEESGGDWTSPAREVNGGKGHGSQGWELLHFGLPEGPDVAYDVTVRFHHGGAPDATIPVVPAELGGYQLLTVVDTDLDADGIPNDVEMADAAGEPDPDGDGRPAWLDADADGDGRPDAVEAGDDDPCTEPDDRDGNGVPDYLEEGPEIVEEDAGPMVQPDAGPDAGAPLDAGSRPEDGGRALEVHGSGCAECGATPARRVGHAGWALAALAFLVTRARRYRRSRL